MVAAATYHGGEHLIDIAGPQVLTFFEITERIAAALGVDMEVVDVPSMEPEIATRELTKITGDDPAYVQPLMETLAAGDLVARHDGCTLVGSPAHHGIDEAIADSIAAYRAGARTA